MEIRDAAIIDVPAIARLYETMRRQLVRFYIPESQCAQISQSYWEEHFFEQLSSGHDRIVVACDHLGGIVGMADAGSPMNSKRGDWDNTERYFPFCDFQLHAVFVDPAHRRRKIGTMLMLYLMDSLGENGSSMVYWAHESDYIAQNFCLRLDARIAGVREVAVNKSVCLENAFLWQLPSIICLPQSRSKYSAKVLA
jgi:ribosomal protein S18 acetylase RimI-like enzyme